MLQQSSNHAYSPGDNIALNVPRTSSPVAQNSAGQSPSQVSDSSLFQRSEEGGFEKSLGSPWPAREIERIPQNDLRDPNTGPVEERFIREDLIRQTETASKEHDSAITKHLAKKAAVEEKLKVWQLDSAVSDSIDDSDEYRGNPLQSGLAIEKRIRELKEASKRQDLAIQKHHAKKAALERGIKRHLDSESGQPSKKPILGAEQEVDVAVPVVPQNAEEINQNEIFGASRDQTYVEHLHSFGHSPFSECNESILEDAIPHQGRESTDNITLMSTMSRASMYGGSESQTDERRYGEIFMGDRYYPWYTVQESKPQPFKETTEQRDKHHNLEYASEGPATSGRSFTNWLLRRRPLSFGSVMDVMLKKFERVAIGAWPARKARHKRAVPVDVPVKT